LLQLARLFTPSSSQKQLEVDARLWDTSALINVFERVRYIRDQCNGSGMADDEKRRCAEAVRNDVRNQCAHQKPLTDEQRRSNVHRVLKLLRMLREAGLSQTIEDKVQEMIDDITPLLADDLGKLRDLLEPVDSAVEMAPLQKAYQQYGLSSRKWLLENMADWLVGQAEKAAGERASGASGGGAGGAVADRSNAFWLQGKHGMGKSTAVARFCDAVKQSGGDAEVGSGGGAGSAGDALFEKRLAGRPLQAVVAPHFCRYGTRSAQPCAVVRSIAHELATHSVPYRRLLRRRVRSKDDLSADFDTVRA
jgi:hypothetical protein